MFKNRLQIKCASAHYFLWVTFPPGKYIGYKSIPFSVYGTVYEKDIYLFIYIVLALLFRWVRFADKYEAHITYISPKSRNLYEQVTLIHM